MVRRTHRHHPVAARMQTQTPPCRRFASRLCLIALAFFLPLAQAADVLVFAAASLKPALEPILA